MGLFDSGPLALSVVLLLVTVFALFGVFLAVSTKDAPIVFSGKKRLWFLFTQFGYWLVLLSTMIAELSGMKHSETAVALWTLSSAFLLASASFCDRVGRLAILETEIVLSGLVFLIPMFGHYTTYHGQADLFFHQGIANEIARTGFIPHSDYASWPLWHIGVADLALLSGADLEVASLSYIIVTIMIAVPLLGALVYRLTRETRLAALASILLLVSPAFLTWYQFLTPTSMCFGLFTILIWGISRGKATSNGVIALMMCIAIILTHHLSPVIATTVLFVGYVFSRRGGHEEGGTSRRMAWGARYLLIIFVTTLAYWLFQSESFFSLWALKGVQAFENAQVGLAQLPGGTLLNQVALSFFNFTILLFIAGAIGMSYVRKKNVLGVRNADLKAFSAISVLSYGSVAQMLMPLALSFLLVFSRWTLYGWFALAFIGSIFLTTCWRKYRIRSLVGGLLAVIILATILSAAAVSAYDTLPFREPKIGISPTPYLLESEEALGSFVQNHHYGGMSSDIVFLYFFAKNNGSFPSYLDVSYEGLTSGQSSWIVRISELQDRGLFYKRGLSNSYPVSPSEMQTLLALASKDIVADTGTSLLVRTA